MMVSGTIHRNRFLVIISQYNTLREINFINQLTFLAREDKDKFILNMSDILTEDLNVHLKYLLIKTIKNLLYPEFFPLLLSLLKQESKTQILKEIISSLEKYNSMNSYLKLQEELNNHTKNVQQAIKASLKTLKSKNKEIYYFDILYNEYEHINPYDLLNAGNFLAKNLETSYLTILLSRLSHLTLKNIKGILNIFRLRPDRALCSGLLRFFYNQHQSSDKEVFTLITESLINSLQYSLIKNNSFKSLLKLSKKLSPDKEIILLLNLVKLRPEVIFIQIKDKYHQLNETERVIFLENLQKFTLSSEREFFRAILLKEYAEKMLTPVLKILLNNNDQEFIFKKLDSFSTSKRDQILSIIINTSPVDLSSYLIKYLSFNEPDKTLTIVLHYFLSNYPDKYFNNFNSLLNSGVSFFVKTLIIRKLDRFKPVYQKKILLTCFSDKFIQNEELTKSLLISIQKFLSREDNVSNKFRDQLLNKTLILMEKSPISKIVDFIYFFNQYKYKNRQEARLVIEELKLMQNTFLKTRQSHDFIRMIHVLINNIQKKSGLPLV
jgi:hypothetical protein